MTTLSYTVPTPGSTLNQIADPEIATALTSILNWSVNIDSGNVTSTFAPAAGVNQSGQTVKGAVNIPASETRSNMRMGRSPRRIR